MVSQVHCFTIKSQQPGDVSRGFQVSPELYESRLAMTGPGAVLRGVPSAAKAQQVARVWNQVCLSL